MMEMKIETRISMREQRKGCLKNCKSRSVSFRSKTKNSKGRKRKWGTETNSTGYGRVRKQRRKENQSSNNVRNLPGITREWAGQAKHNAFFCLQFFFIHVFIRPSNEGSIKFIIILFSSSSTIEWSCVSEKWNQIQRKELHFLSRESSKFSPLLWLGLCYKSCPLLKQKDNTFVGIRHVVIILWRININNFFLSSLQSNLC